MAGPTTTKTKTTLYERKVLGINYTNAGTTQSEYVVDFRPATKSIDSVTGCTHPGPPYKEGGPVSIVHTVGGDVPGRAGYGSHWLGGHRLNRYVGAHWLSMGTTQLGTPSWGPWNGQSLDSLGATGWKKFQPGKPSADLGVFLGESHEIPRMLRDSVKTLKDLATHPLKSVRNMSWMSNRWLCYQFGWLPFLRDLEKLYNTYKNLDSKIARLRKYNGQWERRGGTIFQDWESRPWAGVPSYMAPSPNAYNSPPEGTPPGKLIETVGTKIWFVAAFKYYIADFESPLTQLRLKARLYGLTQTPLIVWNLIPWSWLVDWVSNIGDNIENLCPIDGLTAKYAYVMRYNYYRLDGSVSQRYKNYDGSYTTFHASNSKCYESKGRAVATPFGFGLSDEDFSLRQWSILTALGFQRKLFS